MRALTLAALLALALAAASPRAARAGGDVLDEAAAALEAKFSDLDGFKMAAEDKLKAEAAEAADIAKHKVRAASHAWAGVGAGGCVGCAGAAWRGAGGPEGV